MAKKIMAWSKKVFFLEKLAIYAIYQEKLVYLQIEIHSRRNLLNTNHNIQPNNYQHEKNRLEEDIHGIYHLLPVPEDKKNGEAE